MHHAVGIALIVFAVAVVAGLAVAGVRGLAAWRALKRFKGNAGDGMIATAARIEQIEARTAAATAGAERLSRAQTDLQQSLAEAAVIREAADEVWTLVQRVRRFVPLR